MRIMMTSEEVIAVREKLGLSRKELAQRIDVPYETLCRWENGNRSPSKYYETQLRKLSGNIIFHRLKQQWIFLAPNIKHIRTVVSRSKGIMFGTVHALLDQNESLFLATVRLRPNARSLHDLKPYISNEKNSSRHQRRRIVGFFVAVDRKTSPGLHMLSFMNGSGGHCVVYSKEENDFVVWKCSSGEPLDPKNVLVHPIPYLILG
jgi:transcriptional regulator with XRE-family HTH domain